MQSSRIQSALLTSSSRPDAISGRFTPQVVNQFAEAVATVAAMAESGAVASQTVDQFADAAASLAAMASFQLAAVTSLTASSDTDLMVGDAAPIT